MTSLIIKELTVKNHHTPIFGPMSFTVKPGEVLSLMGPSGCGKSTLLNIVAGHNNTPFTYTGNLYLGHKSLDKLPAYQREIGLLFQDDLLFPHLNIWENLAFALPAEIKGTKRHQQALEALESIGLIPLANHHPSQVSGGQRARISLMRTLLAKPKAILLDEPFSKLDPDLRQDFRQFVFNHISDCNVPTLMVTHNSEDIPLNGKVLTWPW
ncbi:ATP-binding cassette domain-containing protein [Photobacterium damselae]|uniref:ATP-binding cassette domain-containing protein n=1 Tax=Photobacterium damselae TaxID=38293 RepID=UPI001EFDDA43|nr:ATP-binding cassette domain-containing protein [Photobacterium damselae]MCG9705520.1 ATP-binding cassette domain-containing protein [Photobacterium damselae]